MRNHSLPFFLANSLFVKYIRYVVCDLTEKIAEFATKHQLVQSPDQEGYFGYHNGYKMYIEIMSFKKLMNDAMLRNKIFFKKLQLE